MNFKRFFINVKDIGIYKIYIMLKYIQYQLFTTSILLAER